MSAHGLIRALGADMCGCDPLLRLGDRSKKGLTGETWLPVLMKGVLLRGERASAS